MSGPLPPTVLRNRTPQLHKVAAGDALHRFYTGALDPIFFDRSLAGRLNAPDASYGVLYAAAAVEGAFAETFLRRPGRTLIDREFLRRKAYVQLEAARELTLIRLAGPGLAILGATAEVVHGGLPYDVPQAWSKALSGHPAQADGIAYYARHDDEELCIAIFERACSAIVETRRVPDLDQDWFWRLADRYGVGLAPD